MTNNQLTDERIEKIAVWLATESHSLNLEMLTCLRELQERRKAAMDSEPVAVVEPSDYVTAAQLVGEGPARKAVRELYEGALRIGDKLYRQAQPAPVVNEDLYILANHIASSKSGLPDEWLNWAEELETDIRRAAMLQAVNSPAHSGLRPEQSNGSPAQDGSSPEQNTIDHGYRPECECSGCKTTARICAELAGNSPVIPDGYVMVPKEPTDEMNRAGWAAMNEHDAINPTYRAMLAAAPAGIPMNSTKWIPVSERMPETDGNYWGWWSESKRQGPVWFIKSELQAQFQSHEITHWMPLPAAPQNAKP